MQQIKIGITVLSIEKISDLEFQIKSDTNYGGLSPIIRKLFLTQDEAKGLIEILTKELENGKNH